MDYIHKCRKEKKKKQCNVQSHSQSQCAYNVQDVNFHSNQLNAMQPVSFFVGHMLESISRRMRRITFQ